MSLTLADLSVEREQVSVTIPSLKKEVQLRAIPFAEVLQIRAALTKPQPPLKKNPLKGTLAPEEPDYRDAAYQEEFNDYARAVKLAMIARSMGYVPGIAQNDSTCGFGGEHMAAWVNAVEEEFGSVLTEDDVLALGQAYERVNGEQEKSGELDPKVFSSLPVNVQAAITGLVECLSHPSAGKPGTNRAPSSLTATG